MDAPSQSQGAAGSGKHSWLDLEQYRRIHETALERHPFVIHDGTTFTRLTKDDQTVVYVVEGDITCEGGIVVRVSKTLESQGGTDRVRTVHYNYNAHMPGGGNILRYDNSHLGSPDEYHRHRYDTGTWEQIGPTEIIDRDAFPTLIEMVSEVEDLVRAAGLV